MARHKLKSKKEHPIQPLAKDENGTIRFKENAIVSHLLDWAQTRGMGLNEMASMDFSQNDREQFAQLTGYSLGGFSELSYVRDTTYAAAAQMAETGEDEKDARIASLTETLGKVRKGLKQIVPQVFRIHPDDLQE